MFSPLVFAAVAPNWVSPVQLLGEVLAFIDTIVGPNAAKFVDKLDVTIVPTPAIYCLPNTFPTTLTPDPGADICI